MAIYGSMIKENVVFGHAMSLEEFFDFIQESDKQMEIMFEKTDLIQVLKEENTSLSIPTKISFDGDPETVKKTVIQKIKDLVDKFVQMVKEAFANLAKKLQEAYNNANFVDKFVSKFSDKVTFENLKIAKSKGWKGVPTSIPMINKFADAKDSKLYENMNDEYYKNNTAINLDKDIRPIVNSKNLEEAKEKYNQFVEKLNKVKEEEKRETSSSYIISKNLDQRFDFKGDAILKAYFVISTDQSDDSHYYPIPEGFAKTKKFAEEGQSLIKQVSQGSNAAINNLKLEKGASLNNLKSAKGTNSSDNAEINQINILYCKAIYQNASQRVSVASKILRAVLGILRMQHRVAIQGYMQYVSAINRFVLNNAKTAEA